MEKRFNTEFMVDFFTAGPGLVATAPWIVAYLQETSIRHTDSTPFPMQWYSDNGFCYLLTNWHIKINKYPKLGDKIKAFTWPVYFKGILCERYFEMQDENKNIISQANSKWVYMDLNKRRPRKPPAEHEIGYGGCYPTGGTYDYDFVPDISEYIKINTGSFKTTRRDIDANNHVNNIRYIEWATDNIPDEIFNLGSITEMKIAYKKECNKDQELYVETYVNKNNKNEIYSEIKENNPAGALLFRAYFYMTNGM